MLGARQQEPILTLINRNSIIWNTNLEPRPFGETELDLYAAPQPQIPEGWQLVPKDDLLRIARLIEDLKQSCGMDPETPQAIRNGRYQSIALMLRAMADAAPKEPK